MGDVDDVHAVGTDGEHVHKTGLRRDIQRAAFGHDDRHERARGVLERRLRAAQTDAKVVEGRVAEPRLVSGAQKGCVDRVVVTDHHDAAHGHEHQTFVQGSCGRGLAAVLLTATDPPG